MIIAAFSGVGKTTLAKLYPKKVIDFVCMPYKYKLDENKKYTENDKANPELEYIIGWEEKYVEAIKKNMSDDKILLIPSAYYVLKLLEEENIPYILCYPQRKARNIYKKRYKRRGNSEPFIDIFIKGWNGFMDNLEKDSYGEHIVLEPNQFLSDVIDVEKLLEPSIPADVTKLIPIEQLEVTKMSLSAYQDCIENLKIRLQKCPNIGETDSMKEHPAIFHYFYGKTDFYICEYNKENLMFGYVILNGDLDNSEWGYFGLSDLTEVPQFNIDYYFEEQSIEAALYKKYPKHFKKPES